MEDLYTSYDQLPLTLNAYQVAKALGISSAKAYELMHTRGFPAIKVGSRYMVPKSRFIAWLESSDHLTQPYQNR